MIGGFPSADVPIHTVRQVLVAQLDEAIKGLSQGAPSDRVVHQIREKLKRARAALRLLRPCIGAQAYHRQNLLIRDVARPLTMVRDSEVLLHTLRGLELDAAKEKAGAAVDKADAFSRLLHRELRRERIEERRRLGKRELHDEAAALLVVKRRIESISGMRLDGAALGAALERTTKPAARRMRRSCADPPTSACTNGASRPSIFWPSSTSSRRSIPTNSRGAASALGAWGGALAMTTTSRC